MAGIDCHIGSQITDVSPYLDALDRVLDLVESIEAAGIPIHHMDLGGGLGIAPMRPPLQTNWIAQLLQKIVPAAMANEKSCLNLAASLVGNSGVLLTEVMFLKPGSQKNFCVVDAAAMNDLMRPALYEAYMGIVNTHQRPDIPPPPPGRMGRGWPRASQVTGWVVNAPLPFNQAMCWLFCLPAPMVRPHGQQPQHRGRAAELMIDGSTVHVIRTREAVEDPTVTRLLG